MTIIFPNHLDSFLDIAEQARRLADDLERLSATNGRAALADLADAPVLDGWRLCSRIAPALAGKVSGHPLIGEGRSTITSELFALDPAGRFARTWSRWYRLGVPCTDDATTSRRGRLQ